MPIWNVLIPLALSAAGAGASYAGQQKSAKAQQKVLANYRSRNKEREAQANAEFQKSLDKSGADTAQEELDKGTQRRLATYESLAGQLPTQPLPLGEQKNTTVKTPTSGAQLKNAGTAWSRLMNNANAKLGSYADWKLNQGIKDTRTNQAISRITSEAQSDLNNVVPVEMAGAARKGDALQGWGTILSAAGALTGMAAALTPAAGAGVASRGVISPAVDFGTAPNAWAGLNAAALA